MDVPIDGFDLPFPFFGDAETDRSGICQSREERLIRSAAAGDEEAFCRIVELFQDRIFRFCLQWLRDPDDAREVCQDTFIRAYGAIAKYRNRGAQFSTWLYRIALNLCRDRHKSKSARQRRQTLTLDTNAEGPLCFRPSPDESARLSDDLEKLYRGIDSLPEPLRTVTILCGIEGLSQESCSSIMGCSVRAVEGRFYRARKALADWWELHD